MKTFSPLQNYYRHDTTFVKRLTLEEYLKELEEEEKDLKGLPSKAADATARPVYQFQKRRESLTSTTAGGHHHKKGALTFSSKYPNYNYLGRELSVCYQRLENSIEETRRQLQPPRNSREPQRPLKEGKMEKEEEEASVLRRRNTRQKICINTEIQFDPKGSKVLSMRRTTGLEEKDACEYQWEEKEEGGYSNLHSPEDANTNNHNNNNNLSVRFSRLTLNSRQNSNSNPFSPSEHDHDNSNNNNNNNNNGANRHNSRPNGEGKKSQQNSFFIYRDSRKTVLNHDLRCSQTEKDDGTEEGFHHRVLPPSGPEQNKDQNNNTTVQPVRENNADGKPQENKEDEDRKRSREMEPQVTMENEEEDEPLRLTSRLTTLANLRATKQLFRTTTALLPRPTHSNPVGTPLVNFEYPSLIPLPEGARAQTPPPTDGEGGDVTPRPLVAPVVVPALEVLEEVHRNLDAVFPSLTIEELHQTPSPTSPKPLFPDYAGYFITILQRSATEEKEPLVEAASPVFAYPTSLYIGLEIYLPCKRHPDASGSGKAFQTYRLTHFYPIPEIYEAEEVDAVGKEGKSQILIYHWKTFPLKPKENATLWYTPNEAKRAAMALLLLANSQSMNASVCVKGYEYVKETNPSEEKKEEKEEVEEEATRENKSYFHNVLGGLTLIEVSPPWRAVPLSREFPHLLHYHSSPTEQNVEEEKNDMKAKQTVSLSRDISLHQETTRNGFKLLLKTLSILLSKRMIHGKLNSAEQFFVLKYVDENKEEEKDNEDCINENTDRNLNGNYTNNNNNNNNSCVFPLHWEKFMDFNMFADRNVGRSIFYDTQEEGSGKSNHDVLHHSSRKKKRPENWLFQGKDVETLLGYFLGETTGENEAHPFITSFLNPNQQFMVKKLYSLTEEPTQIINYILSVNQCLKALSTK